MHQLHPPQGNILQRSRSCKRRQITRFVASAAVVHDEYDLIESLLLWFPECNERTLSRTASFVGYHTELCVSSMGISPSRRNRTQGPFSWRPSPRHSQREGTLKTPDGLPRTPSLAKVSAIGCNCRPATFFPPNIPSAATSGAHHASPVMPLQPSWPPAYLWSSWKQRRFAVS